MLQATADPTERFRSVRLNLVANFMGQGSAALLGLLFVPWHVRLLGFEAFGLVGIFGILQAALAPWDHGFGIALNRELAQLSAKAGNGRRMRNLVGTLQVISWGGALLLACGLQFLALPLSRHWIQARTIPTADIARAMKWMAVALALQWPLGLYSAGLAGLQRQVQLNTINLVMAVFRFGGVVAVLCFVSCSVQAYFAWQVLVCTIHTALVGGCLWQCLPNSPGLGRGTWLLPRGLRSFAAGMSGISITSLLLVQMDKVLLSKFMGLESLGYYTLASMAASGLGVLCGPFFAALFPRFCQLVQLREKDRLKTLYRQGSQLLSAIVLPAAVIGGLFSWELLFVWTGDRVAADSTQVILSLLIIGSALSCLNHLPYALQLAHGWTALALWTNVASLALLGPLLALLITSRGLTGAAWGCALLNVPATLVGFGVVYSRAFEKCSRFPAIVDVVVPLLVALITGCMCRYVARDSISRPVLLMCLAGSTALVFCTCLFSIPWPRRWAADLIGIGTRYFWQSSGIAIPRRRVEGGSHDTIPVE